MPAILWAPWVEAQSENVNLVKNVDNYSYHSDIWGYTSPGGVELAIVGTYNGTTFVDVTDPANASEIAFISGPSSGWRDIKTYSSYAYIVNEESSGLQIVDLADPLNPQEAATSPYQGAFSTCHNIYIDTDAALLYAVGTDNGMQVLDISNPENPTPAGSFSDFYIHDIFVTNGVAYAGAIFDGFVATLDVTSPGSITTLDSETTPSFACHNAWATEDGQYCLTSDETAGGHVGVYSVATPSSISFVAEWEIPEEPNSSVHNVLVKNEFAIIAWYTAGLQILDVSLPGSPQRVGFYDTHPGNSGFDGAWGAYPYADNGLIYVSDMSTGLYIFEFTPTFGVLEGYVTDGDTGDPIEDISVTVPSADKEVTTDETGYYKVVLDAGSYDVFYDAFFYEGEMRNVTIGQGVSTQQDLSMTPLPAGSLAGTVTEEGSGTALEGVTITIVDTPLSTLTGANGSYAFPGVPEEAYTVHAEIFGHVPETAIITIQENQETVRNFELSAACLVDDIETDQGWTVGAPDDDATKGIWVRVDPNGTAGGSIQPEDDHTTDPGVICWVTGQGSPGGTDGENDVDGGKTTLTTPSYDLSGAIDPILVYHRWYSNASGSNPGTDIFVTDISSDGGTSWTNLETLGETRTFWERVEYNLSDFINPTNDVLIRFIASDEGGGSIVEAAIDDLEIFCGVSSSSSPEQGTTAFVARLFPAAPNPASGPTTLRFQLAQRQQVRLDVLDLQGRMVRTLVRSTLEPGAYEFVWDGRNNSGHRVAGGVYLQRLATHQSSQSRKIVIAE
jgi:choice-of-anchor B domain-containing protein